MFLVPDFINLLKGIAGEIILCFTHQFRHVIRFLKSQVAVLGYVYVHLWIAFSFPLLGNSFLSYIIH